MQIVTDAELGRLPLLPPGTVVERHSRGGDVWRYYSVGAPPAQARVRLGLDQESVWLRESERSYILSKRPGLFSDIHQAIAYILASPLSVHTSREDPDGFYFIGDGGALRSAGLLHSQRTKLVDLVITRQSTLEGVYIRVVHCSPTTRNFGGRQLWP